MTAALQDLVSALLRRCQVGRAAQTAHWQVQPAGPACRYLQPRSGLAGQRPGVMIGGMGASADAGDAPLAPGQTPYLPEPTGSCPVGTTSLYLNDGSRPDPWAAGVNARELMVSLWYPATPSDGRRARYMTPAESELQLTSRGITGVPQDALSTVRANAVSDATPAGRQRALPLVVLSPGFTNPRSTLTALAEDLASHGYVVAGIDHTYESYATAFPDGRVPALKRGRVRNQVAGPRGRFLARPRPSQVAGSSGGDGVRFARRPGTIQEHSHGGGGQGGADRDHGDLPAGRAALNSPRRAGSLARVTRHRAWASMSSAAASASASSVLRSASSRRPRA
jgi:Platelet-activating factor acetylhydrolase, isoform II